MLSTIVKIYESINSYAINSAIIDTTTSHKSIPNVAIVDLQLDELYKLIAQHRMYLEFLKECGICDDEKKQNIVSKCEGIFHVINGCISSSKSVSK